MKFSEQPSPMGYRSAIPKKTMTAYSYRFLQIIAINQINAKVQFNQIHSDELKNSLFFIEFELDRLTFLKSLLYCCQFTYILRSEALTVYMLA